LPSRSVIVQNGDDHEDGQSPLIAEVITQRSVLFSQIVKDYIGRAKQSKRD
jgi:hypothetical protein